MKKNSVLALGVLCAALQVSAESSLKVRVGAFIPQSSLFREIYHTAGPLYEIEYAYRFCNHWDVWVNFDWFSASGKSVGLCNKTKIQLPNFSVGAKYAFLLCRAWEIYLGLGPTFGNVRLKNNSSVCGCEKVSKAAIGFVIKAGAQKNFCDRYFVDMFADYVFQRPIGFERSTDLGGLRLGAGLGITF